MVRTCVAVAGVLLLCAGSAWGYDAKEDLKMLEGTWVPMPMSGEAGGKKFPEEILKKTTLVIKDGKYAVTVDKDSDKGTFTIDTTKKPKTMDIVGTEGPNKDKTILAIYELDGDTLKVCYDLEGKERPKEFKTKEGAKDFMVVYKRQKP